MATVLAPRRAPTRAESIAPEAFRQLVRAMRATLPPGSASLRIHDVTEEMFDALVDDEIKADLIDGVLIVPTSTALEHDDVAGFVRFLMRGYAERTGQGRVLGPNAEVHLATCRRFFPDGLFLSKDHLPDPLPGRIEGTPGLALEVLSPSNRRDDLVDKRPAYREAGTGELWFIDLANEEVILDRRRGRRYVESRVHEGRVDSRVLTGFWLDASWLWARPLPEVLACLEAVLGKSPR